jgi:hypothetical protein
MVAALPQVSTVFPPSNTGLFGSNPLLYMFACVYFVFVLLSCVYVEAL